MTFTFRKLLYFYKLILGPIGFHLLQPPEEEQLTLTGATVGFHEHYHKGKGKSPDPFHLQGNEQTLQVARKPVFWWTLDDLRQRGTQVQVGGGGCRDKSVSP